MTRTYFFGNGCWKHYQSIKGFGGQKHLLEITFQTWLERVFLMTGELGGQGKIIESSQGPVSYRFCVDKDVCLFVFVFEKSS